ERQNGVILLSADHGNVEMMTDPVTGEPHTAHTTLDVPVVLINAKVLTSPVRLKGDGCLADLAPTVLALMGLKQPVEMTGVSLLDFDAVEQKRDKHHGQTAAR
ncbi:MAG TPA: hypothetical protein DCL54_00295, partial [Alphaproteobacteria bacterium]|nr:hypothetical protein [Alphaproteobacteria bacterium]